MEKYDLARCFVCLRGTETAHHVITNATFRISNVNVLFMFSKALLRH